MQHAIIVTGAKAARVYLPATIARSSSQVSPTDAFAGMRLHTSGDIEATPDSSTGASYSQNLGKWLLQGVASDYEAMMTTGTPSSFLGQVQDTWLPLGSIIRDWYAQITGLGTRNAAGTLSIRDAVTQEVLVTCSVTMFAYVETGG